MSVTWRNAALASLLNSSASVAGQQIFLVPLSSSPTNFNRNLYEAEPPCRQRRLEPWRQQVREQCRADAYSRCLGEPRDPRHEGQRDAYVSLHSSSSPLDALFEDAFATGRGGRGGFGEDWPKFASLQDAGDEGANEDPLDELFNRMLGFSLRAFDQMVTEEQAGSPEEEEGTEEEEGAKEEYLEVSSPSSSEDASADDSLFLEYVESAPTPEQAAENALDLAVASLAARSSAAAAASADVDEVENEATAEEDAPDVLPLPSADDLPRLLARRGDALLALAAAGWRRRLTEGAAAEDPRARVEARLARRLTEYRTDLFFSPADGSVTLYTTHVRAPPSPAVGASPAFLQPPREAPPPALGTGSRHLDACVRSAFQNRDLSGGCHRAVGELLLAVDHGSPASRYHGEFGAATKHDEGENVILAWFSSSSDGEHAEVFFQQAQQKGCPFSGVAMLIGLLCSVFLLQKILDGEEEEDDDNEEELEETEEVVGRFDYATLPNDDTPQVSKGENPSGQPRVFVGVPVQVV